MHPLAAIALVLLTGLAWMVTILTLLVALTNRNRRRPPEVGGAGNADAQAVDVEPA